MKFYNQQHEFYCGIDLHANSMHVCVVDHDGEKHLHKNFDTKRLPRFLAALQPFEASDLIIGCESTFNWYWLADLCHQRNLATAFGGGDRRALAGTTKRQLESMQREGKLHWSGESMATVTQSSHSEK